MLIYARPQDANLLLALDINFANLGEYMMYGTERRLRLYIPDVAGQSTIATSVAAMKNFLEENGACSHISMQVVNWENPFDNSIFNA